MSYGTATTYIMDKTSGEVVLPSPFILLVELGSRENLQYATWGGS